jgi:hypothetical protein
MPEILWKAYIDFETEEGERELARALYERLLALSGHVKVWISYALFEAESIPVPRSQREEENDDEDAEPQVLEGDVNIARRVFERGYQDLKKKELKSEVCRCYRLAADRAIHPESIARCASRSVENVRGKSWLAKRRCESASHDAHRHEEKARRSRDRANNRRFCFFNLATRSLHMANCSSFRLGDGFRR